MRITPDTNVLLRAAIPDDPAQALAASRALADASHVAVTIAALCEFVWVLRQGYKRPASEIGNSIRTLVAAANVSVDRNVVEAGLAFLDAGGDFADGVIADEGSRLGGATFLTFDRKAAAIAGRLGVVAALPELQPG